VTGFGGLDERPDVIEAEERAARPDLVTFLRARLDEDEAVAREVQDAPKAPKPWALWADGYWAFVAADPARILAEVAAKRAIADAASEAFGAYQTRMTGTEIRQNEGERLAFTTTLRHLAAVYASHPGYREEWKP